jgi:subtilase family serine protease
MAAAEPRDRTRARWRHLLVAGALCALALPASALSASASDARVPVAGLSPVPTTDVVVNRVITTSFDLALAQPHATALRSFITSLADPSSRDYHRYLTPAQYARRYGATTATITAVRSYFSRFGLRVGALSAGHNILHVSGTTTQIARAFDASVETVRLNGTTLDAHFTSRASLPAPVAKDVAAVAGLSNVRPETTALQPSAHASKSAVTAGTCPSAGSSTGTTPNSVGGYTVQQQAALYGLSTAWTAGDTGVGQIIGIYELSSFDSSDLQTYLSCYALAPTLNTYDVDGGPSSSDNAGDAPDEATLDVEETAALAPGAALDVYQGTQAGSGPTDIYSEIASQDTATIVTTSWGICEADSDGAAQAEQPIFEEMAAQGQTVVAAAGDEGSSDCEGVQGGSTSAAAVDDPASQPYVTGVGGLTVSDISPLSESVWNDDCTSQDCGASGGGSSITWSRPSWQVAPGINTATQTMRMVPDLSVMGDPATGFIQYYTGTGTGFCRHSCSGGWGSIGGTSIGAPLVSSLIAVAAQGCGLARLGFVNPALYAMAATGYNDVTSGNNDLFGVGVYAAGVGYDMASGLGSPNGSAFLSGLCPAAFSSQKSSFAVSSSTGVVATTGPTVSATLRNASGAPLANASVDVTATAASGTLSIDGVTSTQSAGSATTTVTSNASGVVSFTVGSSLAQAVTVTVTLGGQSIYTTTITYSLVAASTKPGAPVIKSLVPRVGGFLLVVRPPTSNGGSAIRAYQYSINGGASWAAFAKGALSIVVSTLAPHHSYRVYVRALNAQGASVASTSRVVVTRS